MAIEMARPRKTLLVAVLEFNRTTYIPMYMLKIKAKKAKGVYIFIFISYQLAFTDWEKGRRMVNSVKLFSPSSVS